MTETKKQRQKGRSPAGDNTKKIVSLTIDPALIHQIDVYAADKSISRSSAIETAIVSLLALEASSPLATADHRLGQSDGCMFASPSLGAAILY